MLRPVFLMFFGEFLIIYAENYAAKNANVTRTLLQRSILILLALCSGLSLILAYKIWYQYRDNIRIVVALSIWSIVFVEPIISWTMFQEIPNIGAMVGWILWLSGMCCAMFWK